MPDSAVIRLAGSRGGPIGLPRPGRMHAAGRHSGRHF